MGQATFFSHGIIISNLEVPILIVITPSLAANFVNQHSMSWFDKAWRTASSQKSRCQYKVSKVDIRGHLDFWKSYPNLTWWIDFTHISFDLKRTRGQLEIDLRVIISRSKIWSIWTHPTTFQLHLCLPFYLDHDALRDPLWYRNILTHRPEDLQQ